MRVLTVLTYYRPYTSGLTIFAERLSKSLAKQGHQVSVLCMQHSAELPIQEDLDGVHVWRAPVLARISKGVISPAFFLMAFKLAGEHDVVHLHLPQFDAGIVALLARLRGKAVVITYHCDLLLPPGLFNRFVNLVVNGMNHLAGLLAHRVVAYTQDYASHSPFFLRHKHKLRVLPPPVEMPHSSTLGVGSLRERFNPKAARPVIGMAARLAAEKGVEVLVSAIELLKSDYPNILVLFAGQHLNVLGETEYADRMLPKIKSLERAGHWRFCGLLKPDEMGNFFSNLDILVVPSLNSTESFGLVQIEAMLCGIPCVASNLPGVRQPILTSGMGEIAEIGDAQSLHAAILKVLRNRSVYQKDPKALLEKYSPDNTAKLYSGIYEELGLAQSKPRDKAPSD